MGSLGSTGISSTSVAPDAPRVRDVGLIRPDGL